MAFFKKFVNTFNKKELLNIEHQSENFEATNNNFKEIDNKLENASLSASYILLQEKNWPEIQQNFDLNCGNENGDSTLFDNDQFTLLTNNSEDLVIEPPRLFINGENQLTIIPTLLVRIFFFFAIVIFELKPILIRLELSKNNFNYMLDPQQILFTQAQINSYFL
ncbi:23724_t:CDS:2, partial [Gigaspora rosea]